MTKSAKLIAGAPGDALDAMRADQQRSIMKYLVVGGGSMGKRRIRCLLANNVKPEQIRMVDVRADRQAEVKEKHNVDSLSDLGAGLEWNPDAVVVSVPGAAHMEVNLAAARRKKHVFCEVPLATSLEGVEELSKLVEQHKLTFASGCQPPMHPLFKQVKQWMGEPEFGPTLCVIAEFGQYLPDWHPYEDYRKFYAADQKMGGGNLDVIAQELAMFYWLLQDRATELFAAGHKVSSLEIKANDVWDISAGTSKGTRMFLHCDLIQRVGRNTLRFISENGTIELSMVEGTVRRFLASTKQWETKSLPQGYVYEQCYIDEIGTFIGCIENKAKWYNPLPVAIDVVKFLLAMQQSAETKTLVKI
jgi:predicted dehydrogenase